MDAELEQLLAHFDMVDHYRAFMRYARAHYTGAGDHDYHLALKVEHSIKVFRLACELAAEEAFFVSSPLCAKALAISALYHDLGRFMQYVRYKTFNDRISENHARIGVRELKRLQLFSMEPKRIRHLALAAVYLHNRFNLKSTMNKDALAVANALRDADKLDILRVMISHLIEAKKLDPVVALGVSNSKHASQPILAAVLERRLANYGDLATVTDFKLLLCGWFYDLNYAWSRKAAMQGGFLNVLLEALPDTAELQEVRLQLEHDFFVCA